MPKKPDLRTVPCCLICVFVVVETRQSSTDAVRVFWGFSADWHTRSGWRNATATSRRRKSTISRGRPGCLNSSSTSLPPDTCTGRPSPVSTGCSWSWNTGGFPGLFLSFFSFFLIRRISFVSKFLYRIFTIRIPGGLPLLLFLGRANTGIRGLTLLNQLTVSYFLLFKKKQRHNFLKVWMFLNFCWLAGTFSRPAACWAAATRHRSSWTTTGPTIWAAAVRNPVLLFLKQMNLRSTMCTIMPIALFKIRNPVYPNIPPKKR